MTAFRFWSGKGGVGKTSCAAASAVRAADAGQDVLVVSMDPAHSLGDALAVALGPDPTDIALRATKGKAKTRSGGGRLRAIELDADAALDRWIDERRDMLRSIAARGTYLDDDDLDRFFRLSLPGVDELIGLLELERIAGELAPDLVVVDTAPTGHTLRMLEMPVTLRQIARVLDDMQEKHRVITSALSTGDYRSDAADALIDEIDDGAQRVAARLRDGATTRVSWVCLPHVLSVEETADGIAGLARLGVSAAEIVVNRITPPPPGSRCALCDARRTSERAAISELERRVSVPRRFVVRLDVEPRGVAALRGLGEELAREDRGRPDLLRTKRASRPRAPSPASARRSVAFAADPALRLVLFGGKGGVGKTTCAAAAAIAIAEQHPDRRVLALSTDPAHSLGDVLDLALSDEPRRVPGVRGQLDARELDAPAELARRKAHYGGAIDDLFDTLRGSSRLDPSYDRAIIHDLVELAPPGIDELFAAVALLDAIHPGDVPFADRPPGERYDLVVVDTAPWGHTERLLELPRTAREWVKTLLSILLKYRGVIGLGSLAEELLALSRALGRLTETWQDPALTVFIPVTRAAALPRLETERLLGALDTLHIRVPSIVVNAVRDDAWDLCRRCEATRAHEHRELEELSDAVSSRVAMVTAPILADPPRGADALIRWAGAWKVNPR